MLDFQVIKELGSGSFGRVLKVKKIEDSSIYAMKIIKMGKLNKKQKQLTLNEIRLLASIDSPYVIQYKGAFFQEQEYTLSILMQYADGGDLEGLLKKKQARRQKMDESQILKISFDILKGLKFLHKNHIMHRDIKTANIFFSNNVAKLGDLNLSKVMKQQFAVTNAGTPYYTSPQIWLGQRYTDNSDIWSLGCVIYEMCTYRPPFEGRNMNQLMKRVISGFYDPIPSIYSKKLSTLIRKCLISDKLRRPSAEELLNSMDFGLIHDQDEGHANLIETIRSPLGIKNLNSRVPGSYSQNKSRQKIRSHHHHERPDLQSYRAEKYRARSIHTGQQKKYIKIKQIIYTPQQATQKRAYIYQTPQHFYNAIRY